jgi:hypothetical protein
MLNFSFQNSSRLFLQTWPMTSRWMIKINFPSFGTPSGGSRCPSCRCRCRRPSASASRTLRCPSALVPPRCSSVWTKSPRHGVLRVGRGNGYEYVCSEWVWGVATAAATTAEALKGIWDGMGKEGRGHFGSRTRSRCMRGLLKIEINVWRGIRILFIKALSTQTLPIEYICWRLYQKTIIFNANFVLWSIPNISLGSYAPILLNKGTRWAFRQPHGIGQTSLCA